MYINRKTRFFSAKPSFSPQNQVFSIDIPVFLINAYGKPNAHQLEKPDFVGKNLVLRFDKPGFALKKNKKNRIFSAKPSFQ